jgi:3-dehydroquinate dehydratase-1
MIRICATLGESRMEDNLSHLEPCRENGVEMVEIRLDRLRSIGITSEDLSLIREAGLESVVTLRPLSHGGMYKGSEGKRSEILLKIMDNGPDHLDIELGMLMEHKPEIMEKAEDHDIGVIISHHDGGKTPSIETIRSRVYDCLDEGAEMAKVVTRTDSLEDFFTLIEAAASLKGSGSSYSLMGTGPFGHLSRIFSREIGSQLVYCSCGESFVEGQVPARDLKRLWEQIRGDISGV